MTRLVPRRSVVPLSTRVSIRVRLRQSSLGHLTAAGLAVALWLSATAIPAAATSQRASDEAQGQVVTYGANPRGVAGVPIEVLCRFPRETLETQTDGSGNFSVDVEYPGRCEAYLNPHAPSGMEDFWNGYYFPAPSGGWSCNKSGCNTVHFIASVEPCGSTHAASGTSCGALSVVDVAPGAAAFTADVRVKLDENKSAGAAGCDPNATYAFADPDLASTKAVWDRVVSSSRSGRRERGSTTSPYGRRISPGS